MQKKTFPLHPAQEDVFTDQLINIESPRYNIGGYIKLIGPLQKEKFHEAVGSAPLVFDVFRMRFDVDEPEPVFHFDDHFERLDLPELDFSHQADASGEARNWVQKRFNTPFIIGKQNLLFEHCLIKISPHEHWFFCMYHHLITDGYGFIIFISYVARKYHSLLANDPVTFSYPPYYKEAMKARHYKNSSAYTSDGEYWREKITARPEKFLHPRYEFAKNEAFKDSGYILNLSKVESLLLKDIQSLTRSGLQQLTIAALLIYFAKTSEQSEFVFGVPVHKRSSRQLRSIFGMFSGILPHKTAYQKDVTLTDLLKDITHTQRRDYRHHNYQIGDLSRLLKLNASEGYLCDVTVNYELLNFDLPFDDLIEATVIQLSSEYQGNPLQLTWRDFGEQQPLQLHMHFRNEYFSAEEMKLFAERIIYILRQFPEALHAKIDDIDILPGNEKELLEKFNPAVAPHTSSDNIVGLFEAQVLQTPDALALVYDDQRISYKELNERSNQLAHYLIIRGVTAETLVPLCIGRSVEMIIALLGILKAGGAYVPIDPLYPEQRVHYILDDTAAFLVITGGGAGARLPSRHSLEIIDLTRNMPVIRDLPLENPSKSIDPHHLSYIIYTSGSTGKPKGVMIEHRGVVNLVKAQSEFFQITADERILQFSNYCFDASVEQIFLALLNGACLVLFKEGLQLEIDHFEHFLNEEKITHLHATPFFLENLQLAGNRYLKRVIAGGDVCKKELSEKWTRRINFYNEYGPTETTVTAIEFQVPEECVLKNKSVPVGKPLANTQAFILDKNERYCPIGVAGELCIGGVQVARGYLHLPDLTAKKFVPDPFSKVQNARLYKTGDICRWLPDGNMEYLGRKDAQVKIRGYRIEPGEIENALLQSGLIYQALVLAGNDSEGNRQLIAYVVPKALFDKDALRAYLRDKLPDYMVPALWVELASLPLTPNGKIDREALPEPDINVLLAGDFVAPRNEVETEMSVIWKELLHVEKVGIHDNFFELGGHSLKAVQLISRLQKRFNIQADVKLIFANPTIKTLGEALPLENSSEFTGIKKLPEQNDYELSHSQKRIWVLSHFNDGSLAYSVPAVFMLEGIVNLAALRKAFDQIIKRHEILRTVFAEVHGEPRQKILGPDSAGFFMEVVDVRGNPDVDLVIKKSIREESSRVFDLRNGPLLRATLFCESDEKYVLVFNIHHIISDGWSKSILLREILFFYRNFSQGLERQLTPLPVQYKDYAAWQAGASAGQGNYWRSLYKDNLPVLNFPLDFERPKSISFSGAMVHAMLRETLTARLHEMAIQHRTTLNNLLLSLYGLLVARYSQQEEVVIGSLTSGRSHVDLENLAGVFINFLPVRLSPQSSLPLSEYLQKCHESLVEAYSHQDYPFDLMVNDCIVQRDASRNPFFDTMVSFHSEADLYGGIQITEDSSAEPGLQVKPFPLAEEDFFHSVLDFKLDIEPVNGRLDLYLGYNSKLFTKETMSGFLDGFVKLLDDVVNEPGNHLHQYFTTTEIEDQLSGAPSDDARKSAGLSVFICASFVAEPLEEYLEYWSKEFELDVQVNFSPYNQLFQQLLDPGSTLNKNKGMNVLLIRPDDWLRDKKEQLPDEQIEFLDRSYIELTKAIDQTRRLSSTPFLTGIVPLSPSHFFNADVAAHITALNDKLQVFLKDKSDFYLLDLHEIASLYLVEEIFDDTSDRLGHIPFTQEYYAALGTFISRKIRAYIGKSYKVIAVDCDNTLWNGICGESGSMGVVIDENFSFLQQFLLGKYHEGFLLALCSKNNEEDVWEVFHKNPGMIITREHIAAHRINWNHKHENLAAIANELNIGLDSIVFLDDSEFEIEQLTLLRPEVLALALPEDANTFPEFFSHIWALDHFRITDEDVKRNAMYKAEKLRQKEQVEYHLLDDFLQSLNIEINLRAVEETDLQRASQLTLRTNQFNLNGVRRSAEEIATFISDLESLKWIIEVKDRFGDYGIVGLLLARKNNNRLVLESFMLSCRVLGRNVEDFVLSELQNHCLMHSYHMIEAKLKITDRNKPFIDFLNRTLWKENVITRKYELPVSSLPQEFSFKNQEQSTE